MRRVLLVVALAMVPQGGPAQEPAPESPSVSEATESQGSEQSSEAVPQPRTEPASRPVDDKAYEARLRAMDQRVSELKERVFRSKARLNLLKETVLHGAIAGARAVIIHRNEMGGSFRLVKAIYSIDGSQVFAKSDNSGALDEKEEFEVFNGTVVPGNHTVTVQLEYRGHGVFPYVKGYTFSARSSHTFTAADGKQSVVTCVGYEKGNFTTDLKDRPAIDFQVNVVTPTIRKAVTKP